MTLVRWSPMRDMALLRGEMDRLFGATNAPLFESASSGEFVPPVDVVETEDAYTFSADLPGMRLEDIKVHLADNVLTLRGQRVATATDNASYVHTERAHGAFERTFRLGTPVQSENVSAKYADGVLTVRVNKSEALKPKEILIQR